MVKTITSALINSISTVAYIAIVASFMYVLQNNFSSQIKTVFIPIAMLLLLVFSAALTGLLVFGKPLMFYLDGKKKEALKLISYTLLFLFIILIIVFCFLISFLA